MLTATSPSTANRLPSVSSWTCSGVFGSSPSASISAMAPTAVFIPVEVTTISARPRVSAVFMCTIEVRSASGESPTGTADSDFATGWDSPVSADSSTSTPAARVSRPSAGTRSPASSSTTSPGTRSAASTTTTSPERRTRAVATSISRSASRLFSARRSWRKPMPAFRKSTTAMTTVSLRSPTIPARTAATTSTMIKTLRNWSRKRRIAGRGRRSVSSLCPHRLRRSSISSTARPREGSTSRPSATCCAERLCASVRSTAGRT